MAKVSAPNPNIFTSDPIEQIFARGVTNRDNTAGLNASWLLAFGDDRSRGQDKYLGALSQSNAIDADLARAEMAMKLREQGMKSATDLIKEGFLPSTLRAGSDLMPDPAQGDIFAKMIQALVQSKTAANYNKGQGAGGKPTTTVQQTMMPWGAAGPTVFTSKNADPSAAYAANQKAVIDAANAIKANPTAYTADQKKQVAQQLMMMTNQRQPGIED